ncbi:MAG: hypothetical protein AB3N20_11285 [Rhizobiaceae bacterium]
MNSQTHLLLAAALFAEPGQPKRNIAALGGAFVPDAAIYGLWLWSKIRGIPENVVWGELYWQQPWQTYTAFGNSLPLYSAILVAGVLTARFSLNAVPDIAHPTETANERWWQFVRRQPLIIIFALAALAHLACDFPVHVDDAHAHLWPLSDWRFYSPVSYWNPEHYGNWFALFEMALGIGLAVLLFRRFHAFWVRALMVLAIIAYVAVPAYFILIIGGGS